MNRSAFTSLSWWIGVAILALSIAAVILARDWAFQTRLFPIVLAGTMGVVAGAHTIAALVSKPAPASVEHAPANASSDAALRSHLRYWLWLIGLIAASGVFGLVVALPAFTLAFMAAHRVRFVVSVPCAVGVWAFTDLFISRFMGMALPEAALRLF